MIEFNHLISLLIQPGFGPSNLLHTPFHNVHSPSRAAHAGRILRPGIVVYKFGASGARRGAAVVGGEQFCEAHACERGGFGGIVWAGASVEGA